VTRRCYHLTPAFSVARSYSSQEPFVRRLVASDEAVARKIDQSINRAAKEQRRLGGIEMALTFNEAVNAQQWDRVAGCFTHLPHFGLTQTPHFGRVKAMEGPPEEANMEATLAHYALGNERERLDSPTGVIEFERTKDILGRYLPPSPAAIADIGGGPGRYALWLARRGYRVSHRDLVGLHVQQVRDEVAEHPSLVIDTAIGDARQLDLPDASVDTVLLLGPLYHLPRRRDRVQALSEAKRIVRPGGLVFAAAISRWAARLDAILTQKLYERMPQALEELRDLERTGWMKPLLPGSFTGYSHRPRQLRAETRDAGLHVRSVVGIEGVSFLLTDLAERVAEPRAHQVLARLWPSQAAEQSRSRQRCVRMGNIFSGSPFAIDGGKRSAAHSRRRTRASASAKVGNGLAYQADCRGRIVCVVMAGCASRMTREKRPTSAGVVRAMARGVHCRWVSMPRCARMAWNVTSSCQRRTNQARVRLVVGDVDAGGLAEAIAIALGDGGRG
jgi:SAM-dependent methyltransferase